MAWLRSGPGKDAKRYEARDAAGRAVSRVVFPGWPKGDIVEAGR